MLYKSLQVTGMLQNIIFMAGCQSVLSILASWRIVSQTRAFLFHAGFARQ